MRRIASFIFLFLSLGIFAQEQLTLDECYQLVNVNYPLAQQSGLLEKQNTIDLEVIGTEALPQLNFSAQATYQSDVIEIPIPNAGIEPLNKDQYRATVSVNQLIYGGGQVNAALNVKSSVLKTQQKQVEVNLYQLKKQVNQLYFSVLLLQEKDNLLNSKKEQLQAKLKEVKSGIKNGVLLPTSDKTLEAELLKINQQFLEIDLNKTTLIENLSLLIGKTLSTKVHFQDPIITTASNGTISRPELDLFQLKKEEIESSEQLLSNQNSPKLIGF
ncbi:outer membrane efflux protein, partial [hydrothermal vent metagenome]